MNGDSEEPDVSTDPDEWVSIDYVHDQVEAMMSRQWDAFAAWERRFGQILAFASALTVAGIVFLPERIATGPATTGLTFIGLAILLASCLVTLFGLIPKGWRSAPDPRTLRSDFLGTDSRELRLMITDTRIELFELNEKHLKSQLWRFGLSVALLILGILLLLVATVMSEAFNGGA